MKNRRNFLSLIGLVVLLFISFFIYRERARGIEGPEILLDCFKSSRANIEESTLSGWTPLDTVFTEEDLNQKIEMVLAGLQIDKSNVKKALETGGGHNKAMFSANKNNFNYTMTLETMKNDDGATESYCIFRASSADSFEDIIEAKYFIEEILSNADLSMKLDVMITGSYKGKMSQKHINATITKLLNNLNASKVESIERDELVSVSAYCPEIDEYIISNSKKINVQLALRYSSYNDRTYIWLGSPIIPFEY